MPEIEGKTLKKILPVIYVVDTSGSMTGSRIAAVNEALYEYKDILLTKANENPDTEINVGVLKFASKPEWVTGGGLVDINEFYPEKLTAVREPGNLGSALVELGSKLSRNGFLNKEVGYYAPIIVFIGDGGPNDEWLKSFKDLRSNNKWCSSAKIVVVAVDEESDKETLGKLSTDDNPILDISEQTAFDSLINSIAMSDEILSGNSIVGDISYNAINSKSIGNDVNDAKSALRWIIQERGIEIFEDGKTVKTLLEDIADKNDVKCTNIISALAIGAGSYFCKVYAKNKGYNETAKNQLIVKLSDKGLKDISEYIAWVFGYAASSDVSAYVNKNKEPTLNAEHPAPAPKFTVPSGTTPPPAPQPKPVAPAPSAPSAPVTNPVPTAPVYIPTYKPTPTYTPTYTYTKKRKSKKKFIIIPIILLVIGAAIGAIILMFFTPGKRYSRAMNYLDAGDYVSAYKILSKLNYKDSKEIAMNIKTKSSIQSIRKARTGDVITFGTYEQDADLDNGNEDIEWIVLDEQNGNKLLLSKNILSLRQMNPVKNISITWEDCEMRTWLNDSFLNSAFTEEDQSYMLTTAVTPDIDGLEISANTTKDILFLLKIREADLYLSSNNIRSGPTAFARTQGNTKLDVNDKNDSEYWYWWTDTRCESGFVLIDPYGTADQNTDMNTFNGVRPAVWINTEAGDDVVPADNLVYQNAELRQSFYYGKYEQDNDITNGKEDIEWVVIDKQKDKILVLSRYILDCRSYNDDGSGNHWETSDIRSWLNREFINEAFTKEEQLNILSTDLAVPKKLSDDDTIEYMTSDKIFLLDVADFEQYIQFKAVGLEAKKTDYVKSHMNNEDRWIWMLRSKGAYVDGSILNYDTLPDEIICGVRPAMWLSLVSGQNENSGSQLTPGVVEGDIVTFGNFNYDDKNGSGPLEWITLAKEDGKALLITRYGIGRYQFDNSYETQEGKNVKLPFTWETSTTRQYLNNDFYDIVFSDREKAVITETVLKNDQYDRPMYSTDLNFSEGSETKDKVFLLSCDEAKAYFGSDEDRICCLDPVSTDCAEGKSYSWFTRTTNGNTGVWCISNNGEIVIDKLLSYPSVTSEIIRPCVWVDLDLLK